MATYAPFIEDIKIYKGTTFSYQFNFDENGSALDLTTLSDIEVIFSKPGQEIFKHTVSDGDLSISGTDDNELTGEASATTMDIAKRSYDMKIKFIFSDGTENIYVDFDASIIEGENQTAHEWNVDIDTDAETTSGEQLTGLTARAVTAADNAETAETNAVSAKNDAETAETNASTSETNAATSESNAADSASDAEKQAQNTTSFTDSDGNTFNKGAKGFANDAQTSADNAEQETIDASGYYLKELALRQVISEAVAVPEMAASDVTTPPAGIRYEFYDSDDGNTKKYKDSNGNVVAL